MPAKNNDHPDSQVFGHEFYEFLLTNCLLKERPKFDAETEWEIREQVNVQCTFAGRMLHLFESNNLVFTKLCQQMDELIPLSPPTFEKESKLIPFALLINSTLVQYESLKRCLLFALDDKKLDLNVFF